MKLGQAVLDLIDGSFWESTSWSMEDIPLGFSIVSDQYGAFPQYLEVGTFMSDFTTPPLSWVYVCGMMRSLGALGR